MEKFLTSNSAEYRLLRTIVQGIIGVLISNIDVVCSFITIPPEVKPILTMLIVAILSPVMALLGGAKDEKG